MRQHWEASRREAEGLFVAGEMLREKILVEKMDLCLTEWED